MDETCLLCSLAFAADERAERDALKHALHKYEQYFGEPCKTLLISTRMSDSKISSLFDGLDGVRVVKKTHILPWDVWLSGGDGETKE